MTGTAVQGYILSLYNIATVDGWPLWHTVRHMDKAGVMIISWGLCEMIAEKFMPHNRPELALQKLQGLKQGGHLIDNFLMAFDNLKLEANLSDDLMLHILLQNVSVLRPVPTAGESPI